MYFWLSADAANNQVQTKQITKVTDGLFRPTPTMRVLLIINDMIMIQLCKPQHKTKAISGM